MSKSPPVNPNEDSPTVTLQTIADAVGVSRMTVSMALRNHPGVADATRREILKVARRLRYRPNAFASYLSRQRGTGGAAVHHANLALLVGHHDKDYRKLFPGYGIAIQAATERATELGYSLENFWAFDPAQTGKTLDRMLEWRSVRGLIFLSFWPDDFRQLPLAYEHYSLVHAAASRERARCHHPAVDYYAGLRDLLKRIRSRGFQRIGFHLRFGDNENHEQRLSAAFLQNQSNHRPHLKGLLQIDHNPAGNPRTPADFLKWFHKMRPDALIVRSAPNIDYASWLRAAGFWEGLTFFDLNPGFHPRGTVSGLEEPHADMARAAVSRLVSLIQQNETGFPAAPEQIAFLPRWVEAEGR